MGIDPALAVALRRGEEAAAELAGIPDTPDLTAADEAITTAHYCNADDQCEFKPKIERIAEQYIWLASGLRQLVRSEASWALCNLIRFSAWPRAQ